MDAFGIDIGGSGIKGAPVDLERGRFAAERLRIPTPEESTPEAVSQIVSQLLDHFEVDASVPVGVAFPAPVHPGRPIGFMANLDQSWVGVDITAKLSEACRRPVHVVNDADAAGLAESLYGEARRHRGLVVTVTLGTGIGTALVMDALRKCAADWLKVNKKGVTLIVPANSALAYSAKIDVSDEILKKLNAVTIDFTARR